MTLGSSEGLSLMGRRNGRCSCWIKNKIMAGWCAQGLSYASGVSTVSPLSWAWNVGWQSKDQPLGQLNLKTGEAKNKGGDTGPQG